MSARSNLKRAIFELVAEDDHFTYELAGPRDIADGLLPGSMAAAVELFDARLIEIWCDPSPETEGRPLSGVEARRALKDPLSWRTEAKTPNGVIRLTLTAEGDALWRAYCSEGVGPSWMHL